MADDKITPDDLGRIESYREEVEKLAAAEQRRVEAAIEEARLRKLQMGDLEKVAAIEAARSKVFTDIIAKQDAQVAQLQEKIRLQEESGDYDSEKLKDLKEELDGLLKVNKATRQELEDRKDLADINRKNTQEIQNATQGIAAAVGVSDSWQSSITGTFFRMAQTEEGIKKIGIGLKDAFSLQNIGASLLTKVQEATVNLLREQDNAIASFRQATGAGSEYNQVIVDTQFELRTYGVSAAEASEATQALFKEMSQFTTMSQQAQIELAKTAALLQNFGISGNTAGDSMEVFNKALGMSTAETTAATREMFALGQALGIPPEVIFSEFGPAAAQLAAHGDDMIDVFKGMSAASKATGVEISKLLGLAERFDTFEGAATAVGSLNALLGGPYLNSIEMLNASEEERIRLLIQSMEASGRSFGELGKFEQKAIAASVGITDMAEANKLFNTSLSAYDAAQMKAASAAMSQEQFEEASRAAMSVQEKFTAIMQNFAVSLSPVISVLGRIADKFLELQKFMGNGFGIVMALGGAVLFLVGSFKGLALVTKQLGKSLGEGLGEGLKKVGEGAGHAGKAATAGAKGLLALGFATLQAGIGIGLAALGVAELVKAFDGLNQDQIIGASVSVGIFGATMVGLVFALAAAAKASTAAIPALLAVGASFLAIGFGVKLAAEGFAILIPAVGELMTSLESLSDKGFMRAMAMMTAIATIGVFAGAGLAALGLGFSVLAIGVSLLMSAIDLDKIQALADLATAAAAPGPSPFGDMVTAVTNLDDEKIELAKQLATVAMEYNAQVVDNFGPGATAPFETVAAGAGTTGGATTTAATNQQPIYLVLNNEIFGRLVADQIAKSKGLNLTQK